MPSFKHSLAVSEKVLSPDHPIVSKGVNILAGLSRRQLRDDRFAVSNAPRLLAEVVWKWVTTAV